MSAHENAGSSSCCGGPAKAPARDADATRDAVRAGYAEIARSGQWSGVVASECCASEPAAGGGDISL